MEMKHEWNENRIQNPHGAHCRVKKKEMGG